MFVRELDLSGNRLGEEGAERLTDGGGKYNNNRTGR